MNRLRGAVIWVLRIVLALLFAISASGKLDPSGNIAANFQRWGYPLAVMMAIGVWELAGSILLLFPRFTGPACLMLILVMAGSIITHVQRFQEMGWPLLPLALVALLLVVWRVGRRTRPDRLPSAP